MMSGMARSKRVEELRIELVFARPADAAKRIARVYNVLLTAAHRSDQSSAIGEPEAQEADGRPDSDCEIDASGGGI